MSYNTFGNSRAAMLGAEGERRVAQYLRRKGYTVIKRNYRDRFGEIDIIAENHAYLVFVEVKTRSEDAWVSGAEAVTIAKQRRLYQTGLMFAQKLKTTLQPRFDVAEVTLDRAGQWHLRYIKSAF